MVTSFWILNLIGPAGLFEHRPGDFEYNCRVSLFKKINWIEDDCALDSDILDTDTLDTDTLYTDTVHSDTLDTGHTRH